MSNATRTLYLIRHGLVESRYQGRYIGVTDAALSPTGEAQMVAFGRRHQRLIDRVTRIYVSPLARCQASAQRLFSSGQAPLITEAALREIDFGSWEGLSAGEIAQQDSERWQRWLSCPLNFTFPNGEARAAFGERIIGFCRETLSDMPEHCAIIAHAGVIQHLVLYLTGIPFDHQFALSCEPSSLTVLRLYQGNQGVLQRLNDMSHLPGEGELHG